jgi:hypothetical protein
MPGPHVTHDARPQIQGITLAHDRSPDHGESSSAAPVTPSRFHLQARRSNRHAAFQEVREALDLQAEIEALDRAIRDEEALADRPKGTG